MSVVIQGLRWLFGKEQLPPWVVVKAGPAAWSRPTPALCTPGHSGHSDSDADNRLEREHSPRF